MLYVGLCWCHTGASSSVKLSFETFFFVLASGAMHFVYDANKFHCSFFIAGISLFLKQTQRLINTSILP